MAEIPERAEIVIVGGGGLQRQRHQLRNDPFAQSYSRWKKRKTWEQNRERGRGGEGTQETG